MEPRADAKAVLSREKIARYLETTSRALDKARVVAPERSFSAKIAASFREMAVAYFEDAEAFAAEGDLVNAFACVNYAHGWLDAGARLGVFDVGGDDQLFTLLE